MKSLRRTIPYLAPYKTETILAILLLIGVVVADLAIPRLTQRIIDEGIAQQNMALIGRTASMMIVASIFGAIFSISNTLLAVRVAQGMSTDLRSALVRQVQTLSFGNLDRLQTGQLLVRATSDINQIQMVVLESLRLMIRTPFWLLGSVIMLVLISPRLALMMSVLLPAIVGIVWLFASRSRSLFLLVQRKLDKLNGVLQENLAGVRVVKAFVRRDYEANRFAQANEELTAETIKVMKMVVILTPTLMLILNLGVVGAVWFGGNQVINSSMTTGELVASVNYLLSAMVPLLIASRMIGPFSAAEASAERIFEVLDGAAEVQNRPRIKSLTTPVRGRVAFENVSFRYQSDHHQERNGREPGGEPETLVLKNINLAAEPGETVAILGATGSGKSSLIHLIPRFYDVTAGRVTLDGVDVRDLPLELLRRQVGVALQEAILFGGAIRDNLRYGRPEAAEAEIIAAARAAQAHDFIAAFPAGYETVIGPRGVTLSGGQKQRLAIARALLVQPRILILDDSTSAVDVETEAKIQAALESLMGRCTNFIIAQRISTVLKADKIVVLDQGQIVAMGNHPALLASSPIYQEIYHSQLGDGVLRHG